MGKFADFTKIAKIDQNSRKVHKKNLNMPKLPNAAKWLRIPEFVQNQRKSRKLPKIANHRFVPRNHRFVPEIVVSYREIIVSYREMPKDA